MLKDKVIMVTGGSGLIGQSILEDIKNQGGIPINADISVSTDSANEVVCDITDQESIDRAIHYIMKEYSQIDGLVNNAYPRTRDWGNSFENVSMDSWSKNVDMQLNSAFYLSQQILKLMKKQKNGSVVNIASIYGIVGNDFTIYEGTELTSPAAYSAIKGGLINFTRYLASYYGKYGIRVNCVSPGGIFNNQPEAFVKNYEAKVPMKRLGKPDDISPAVSFLLSNGAKYITGQNLAVDGGWTAI